jgi:hypothetical protein
MKNGPSPNSVNVAILEQSFTMAQTSYRAASDLARATLPTLAARAHKGASLPCALACASINSFVVCFAVEWFPRAHFEVGHGTFDE